MSALEKWKRRPQTVWLRKALFQIHLWAGIGLGLYIFVMSVSGSAIVFRRELSRTLGSDPRVAIGPGARMNDDQLTQIARRAYPGYAVDRVSFGRNPNQPAEVWMDRPGEKLQRLFNPYTGADLGDPIRLGFRVLQWVVDLHDNLLLGKPGLLINAAGGICTLLVALTGVVIWWPGIDTWRRSLSFRWKRNPKGLNWTWHSALGFWTSAFLVMWAVSGIYLSIPKTFNAAVDYFEPTYPPGREMRKGDVLLYWLTQAHFGRFDGISVKIIWTVIGLAPAALFITGTIMWWKRVLKPWLGRKPALSPVMQKPTAARPENSVPARSYRSSQ